MRLGNHIIVSLILLALLQTKVSNAAATEREDEVEQLKNEVRELKDEVNGIVQTVKALKHEMFVNIAEQYTDKVIQSILSNDQQEASLAWSLVQANTQDREQLLALLGKTVKKSYARKRSHFYLILEFLLKNNITSGFPLLYDQLERNGHIAGGQEIFVFAHYLQMNCGSRTKLYKKLPQVVKQIISGPISFRNVDDMGYMIVAQHQSCSSRSDCYANPKNEIFVQKSPPSEAAVLLANQRSHFRFLIPSNMMMKESDDNNMMTSTPSSTKHHEFNGTRMSWGFHVKSVSEDEYLIVRMRLTSYFLRDNVTFEPYFAGDLQCQFLPMLIKDMEGGIRKTEIMIGMRNKHLKTTEFIHGANFAKNGNRVPLGRRMGDDPEGKIWKVIPVTPISSSSTNTNANLDIVNNDMSGSEESTENTLHEGEVRDSKCQF